MKLSLRDLDEAARNPRAFLHQQKSPIRGATRYLALRATVLDFHKDNDVAVAQKLLEGRLGKFKTTKGNDEYLAMLDQYVLSFKALGTSCVRARNNISVHLPDEYRTEFSVTGQVARLDIHAAGGYRAWLLTRNAENWQHELRFPLIQAACARQLGVEPDEVIPGIYDFSTDSYAQCQYTKQQIQGATRRLLRLLDEFRRYKA